MKIELHPSLNEFDPLTPDEQEKLRKSIKKNGCRMPLLLWQKEPKHQPDHYFLMDGRHRYELCQALDVAFGTNVFEGTEKEAVSLGRSLNEARRHRPVGIRAMDAAAEVNTTDGRPKTTSRDVVSKEEAAERHNVSVPTVERAKVVLAHGTEELQEAVREGVVTVNDAAAVAKEEPEVQEKAVKAVKEKKAKTAKAAVEKIKEVAPPIADDDPWTDAWGITITKEAEPAFRNADKFDELVGVLKNAKKLYKELSELEGGQFLCLPGVSMNTRSGFQHSGIETAILNIKDAKPKYTVCPYAFNDEGAHPEKCNLCHNLGWIGSVNKDRIPESLIEAAKLAHGVQS